MFGPPKHPSEGEPNYNRLYIITYRLWNRRAEQIAHFMNFSPRDLVEWEELNPVC